MIRAALRGLHSPDVPDLNAFVAEDPDRFGILVQAMIGPEGGLGAESFDFLVCTPAWLADEMGARGHQFGRHYLFVSRYDLELIEHVLRELCVRSAGPDWVTVATYLARYGKWEFEDYVEAEHDQPGPAPSFRTTGRLPRI